MKGKKAEKKSISEPNVSSKKLWIIAVLLGLFALVLNVNTFDNAYVLDDLSAITENSVVKKGTESIPLIWKTNYRYGYWSEPGSLYRPLVLTLFAWQWEHWPNNPRPAHITNVLLYVFCIVALFFLLVNWFGRSKYILALLATALFVAHPIHTEVVANIKSADELLAVLFSSIALIALWKNGVQIFSLWIPLALVSFFLALTSKESVVTLIPIVPLAVYFFSELDWKKSLVTMAWLFVPLVIYMGIRFSVLGGLSGEKVVAGMDNILSRPHDLDWFATAVKICGMYVWKLVIPHPLAHDYSRYQIPIVGVSDPFFWMSLVVYGVMIWLAWKGLKAKATWSFAILFYFVTFSLYSNLVYTIGTHFGERLLFLPSIGFCIGVAWLIWKWATLKTNGQFIVAKAVLPITLTAAILLLYSGKTMARNKDWHTAIELYEADIHNSPNSSRTHYRLGMAYMKERAILYKDQKERNKWIREAMKALKEALRIYPDFTDAQSELGLAYQRLGYRDQAEEIYREILKTKPTHKVTLNNMGTVLFEKAKFDQAIEYFKKAVEQDPRYFDAMGNMASCYGTIGKYDEAITWFKKALQLDPKNASYHYFIGVTYQRMNKEEEARSWLEKAYVLDPKLRPKQ
ncbi:MAG: tetratricopeptide repeat protein [Flavobacteriales bacterium]